MTRVKRFSGEDGRRERGGSEKERENGYKSKIPEIGIIRIFVEKVSYRCRESHFTLKELTNLRVEDNFLSESRIYFLILMCVRDLFLLIDFRSLPLSSRIISRKRKLHSDLL